MPITVLVVEEDALTRETLVYMLEALKYNAFAISNAESAVGALHAVFYDVLLISLTPEDQDGAVLAQQAKQLQPHIKAIVVSGRQPDALKPSVDAFVQKPFSLNQIDTAIKAVLASKGGVEARS